MAILAMGIKKNSGRSPDLRAVLLAQAGDRAALEQVLSDISLPLYRYLVRLCGKDAKLGEDLLQESLLQIFRKIKLLDDPSLFRQWSYRVASRVAFRKLKKQGQNWLHPTGDLEVTDEPTDNRLSPSALHELSLDLQSEMNHLTSEVKAVISLHYFDGFLLADIAVILEIPLGTVKSRLHQGLALLRNRMIA